MDDLETKTLFFLIDRDKDNILSWADFSYLVTDTEGNLDDEQRKAETQRAMKVALEKLKSNPAFVGEGWEKFKKQV